MITAALDGFIIGLSMIIFVGPVFFTLLQSALKQGFKAGLSVAIGIIVSDIICIILCYFGASPFFESITNQLVLAFAGSVILVVLGFKYIFYPNLEISEDVKLSNKDFITLFSKGFLINFVNPFVFLVWIGVITYANEKYSKKIDVFVYLFFALLAILLCDSIKAFFAPKLKRIMQPKYLAKTYKIIGVILILFAIRMLLYILYIN